MAGRIYLLGDRSDLVPMDETPYDSEQILQKLLADYPDLLSGDKNEGHESRRWLLIRREMAVPGDADANGRWSLDHLFLDQDAIPTLVEVKRSSDRRIRRAVIGQMLDYAANGVVYWPAEELRHSFEARCLKEGKEPAEELADTLGEELDIEEFWRKVQANLKAGRIRMVFLADRIPPELRRVVEFLNEQMSPAEVLAIEVRQYIGGGKKTLVPCVFGQTEEARQRKTIGANSETLWNEQSFLDAVERTSGQPSRQIAEDLLRWIEPPRVTRLWWGRGTREGGMIPVLVEGNAKFHICRLNTQGWLAFRFDWLRKKAPFSDEKLRRALLAKINEIPGVHFGDNVLTTRARVRLNELTHEGATESVKSVLLWMIETIRTKPHQE